MTVETISAIAAMLLSLACSYLPGVAQKYQALSGENKRLVMLGLLVLAALGSVGLACTGLGSDFGLEVACNRSGVMSVVTALISALVTNQATYLISPQKHAG